MAWVQQNFPGALVETELHADHVRLCSGVADPLPHQVLQIVPRSRAHAHEAAYILRRAARRLEEIGKGLD